MEVKDKKIYHTMIKGTVKALGNNDYVCGVISGMQAMLCDEKSEERFAIMHGTATGDTILTVECIPERYYMFKEAVEEFYPGLCSFNVTVVK